MAFVERFTSKNSKIPFRCYTDERELAEAFGDKEAARAYVSSIVEANHQMFENAKWLVIATYGYEGTRVAEVFGYSLADKWPGNPVVTMWVFTDGKYEPHEKTSCGNMDIIRGAEESHRRKTKDLEEFLRTAPHLGDLHPLSDAGIIDPKY